MLGLNLSREFFENEALPLFKSQKPQLLSKIAVGLVGEGSECFGFDDELSKDHDYGAAFCIWLPENEKNIWESDIEHILMQLPLNYKNFPSRLPKEKRMDRVGLLSIENFYKKYTGLTKAPQSWQEWRQIPESFLATATNGAVFYDPSNRFSSIRESLLAYYPEDVRLKKIAARLAVMAQSGQYNLLRSIKRNDKIAAMLCIKEFSEAALSFTFLINKKYMPFYKWAPSALQQLDILASETHFCLNQLCDISWQNMGQAVDCIEKHAQIVSSYLIQNNYSTVQDSWLLAHASQVQAKISIPQLRYLPEMAE